MTGKERLLRDVFDHTAEPRRVVELQRAIVEEVCYFLGSPFPFGKISRELLGEEGYQRLKRKLDPLLHYGSFNLPKGRDLAKELIWKSTEATGKYSGCPFWSVKAKALFDQHACWPLSVRSAKSIGRVLCDTARDKAARLTHEHVYPIRDLKLRLIEIGPSEEEISRLFETHALACVVIEEEHDREEGTHNNPWGRYKRAGIQIAENSAWTARQRELLDQARVLNPG